MSGKPMTKAEARRFIRRCREDLRWAETALTRGDGPDLDEALGDAIGALVHIQQELDADLGTGIAGVTR